jgi:hypothetical protein
MRKKEITSKKLNNLHKQNTVLLNTSMFQQTLLAAETHLADNNIMA